MTGQLLPYAAGLIASSLVFIILRSQSSRKHGRLPPGPPPRLFIDNLLDLPRTKAWLTWQSYVEQYGEMVFLSALGRNLLLLGSHDVITELLEKRSSANNRPGFRMFDLMNLRWNLVITYYGDLWRRSRKLLHAYLHAGAAVAYEPIQLSSAQRFVCDLLEAETTRPKDRLSDAAKSLLPKMIRTNFGLTAIRLIYGINVRDPASEEKYIGIPESVIQAVNEAAVPGKFMVDFFPWLQYIPTWFPGAYFKRLSARINVLQQEMRDDPIEVTKAQLASGTAPVSIVARMLENDSGDMQMIKDMAGSVYLAGSDTTVAAVTSYFLAALVYPEVQKRAQEELDRVVGRDRLPEFSDKPQLPYLDAVMRECIRWLPVIPMGVPHSTTEDIEFQGYFIPKGTVCLPFQWGLLQDPQRYPNPSTFSPERYLERLPSGAWKLSSDVPDPRIYAFGFGRRVCPGTHIAEQSLFANLATVLHTIDVTRAKDADGREVIPEVGVNSGVLCHALPFPYELYIRADARVLVEMCQAAIEEET